MIKIFEDIPTEMLKLLKLKIHYKNLKSKIEKTKNAPLELTYLVTTSQDL